MVKKILIAGDEESLRKLIQELLGEEGFTVTATVNGDAAAGKLMSEDFNVLITDLRMSKDPEVMDGLKLARWAKKIQPGIRVILLSGTLPGEMPPGVDKIVLKPALKEVILRTVSELARTR